MATSPIHRIAVPNPFFEGRNSVYVLRCDPVTLIDSGVATDLSWQALTDGLRDLHLQVRDIERVILTHKHIDHIGNAWRLQREAEAEICIHQCETKSLTDVDASGNRFAAMVSSRLEVWRVPEHLHPSKSSDAKMPDWQLEPCEQVMELDDGQILPTECEPLEVIHTPGHTMGSVCLKYGDEALFLGDHVLRAISPNVGGGDMRSRGMLTHFLRSLDRVSPLGNDILLYPGHGNRFDGLADRCAELKHHHDERLAKTRDAVSQQPRTVFEVATELFGELSGFHVVLGCAEANSHLEHLVDLGEVHEADNRFRAE